MKRYPILSLLALAMLVLLPLAAVAQEPATTETEPETESAATETEPATAEPVTDDLAAAQEVIDADATWETDARAVRAETGTLRGTVVLIDRNNLIVETDEGDRAFAIDADTRLPDVLTEEDVDWTLVEGFPVEVAFRPGDPGELRIVDSLSVLPVESQENGEAAATTTATTATSELQTTTADGTEETETTQVAAAGTLPRTASPLPWIGLAGLLALGGAYALRRRSPTRQQ